MNVLIVEDDISQSESLAAIITEEFPDSECLCATSYDKGIAFADKYDIQLFMLDIQLNQDSERNGIAIGKHLRSMSRYERTPILYITALMDEAYHAIRDTYCNDFIVKPYEKNTIIASVNRLIKFSLIQDKPIELKDTNGVFMRVFPENIMYIHSDLRSMHIQTNSGIFTVANIRLTDFCSLLPKYFLRCHKSYIVNTHHISSYDKVNSMLSLDCSGCMGIPVGRKHISALEHVLSEHS